MGWITVTERYEPVRAYREHKGNCPVCGKRVVRKKGFQHTINPFNKNPDGTVRTPLQVREAVEAEADAWQPDFRHNTEACKGATDA